MAFEIATLALENGAKLGVSPLPGRGGQAAADFEVLRRWSPAIVVSMTQTAEMQRHNVGDMAGVLARAGMQWAHFPIRDFGTPEAVAGWPDLSRRLHEVLDRGGAVLCHCYGGQGRSGMVALRLLAERGHNPDAALRRLRDVRPGAVETAAQFNWAAAVSERP